MNQFLSAQVNQAKEEARNAAEFIGNYMKFTNDKSPEKIKELNHTYLEKQFF